MKIFRVIEGYQRRSVAPCGTGWASTAICNNCHPFHRSISQLNYVAEIASKVRSIPTFTKYFHRAERYLVASYSILCGRVLSYADLSHLFYNKRSLPLRTINMRALGFRPLALDWLTEEQATHDPTPLHSLGVCNVVWFVAFVDFSPLLAVGFSPLVRWGLLDFMSVSSPSPPSPSPSPSPSSPPPRLPSPCPVAILCVQCGMSDLNCDPVSSVWRAGLQPRSCECSVAYRTPTAILRVQCGVPDPNRDPANSVWRPGPQPRSCEFSVASRTPTAILWVQCGVPDLKYCVRKFVRKNGRRYVRKNDRRYVRRNVKKICQKICQKECQKICQKICQKECQKICQKECQKICQKEW